MDISKRGKIEWLNYWIEDANEYKRRIILIGDSVTRDLRKQISLSIEGAYCVDLLATSYSILDNMALEEMEHFFEKMPYNYNLIIYNMGAHHGYNIECAKSDEAAGQYKKRTKEILKTLKKYSENVVVMSLTFEKGAGKEDNTNHNNEIRKRNEILKKVSEELDFPFFDLNQEMNYEKIKYVDNYHFSNDSYENMSKLIIEYFSRELHFANSNRIGEIKELNKKLCMYENIYIYGNGIRGEKIKIYMKKQGHAFKGFIVSDEYANLYENVWKINQVKNEDTLIIVTPIDITIWERLEKAGFDYISLGANLYTYMENEVT